MTGMRVRYRNDNSRKKVHNVGGHSSAQRPRSSVGLFSSARTPEEFAFAEFRALAAGGMIEFRQTVTRTPEGSWSGARGRIDPRRPERPGPRSAKRCPSSANPRRW
jgi:hypothetical protein